MRVRIDDRERDIFTYHDYPVASIKFKTQHKPNKKDKDDEDEEEVSEDLKKILD